MTRLCRRVRPWGWYCGHAAGHQGSCPTRPRWWNVRGQLWMRGWIS